MNSLSNAEKNEISVAMNDLFSELAQLRHEPPESQIVQVAIDKMYRFFNQNSGFKYSLEAFAGLGQMYVADTRFTENIDQFGEGLSEFLNKAMSIYAKS